MLLHWINRARSSEILVKYKYVIRLTASMRLSPPPQQDWTDPGYVQDTKQWVLPRTLEFMLHIVPFMSLPSEINSYSFTSLNNTANI